MTSVADRLANTNWDEKLDAELLLEALRQTDGPNVDMDCQIHMMMQPDMPYEFRWNEWWVNVGSAHHRLSSYCSYTKNFENAVAILKANIVEWKWSNTQWKMETADGHYKVTFTDPKGYEATHSNMAIAFLMCVVQLARDLQP